MYDLIVIGAGPSGIMASITAKLNNKKVLLLEKNNVIGKKILLTGNGRGNFTNLYLSQNDYNNPLFVEQALTYFDKTKTLEYFFKLGIPYRTEKEEGRCYPASDQAASLTECLMEEITRLKIDLQTNAEVRDVKKENKVFSVRLKDDSIYQASNVIISAGGLTYPQTGTTGDGYLFAKRFKHTITPVHPALTRVHLEGNFKAYKGARLTTKLFVLNSNKMVQEVYGDIIFNDNGIGGLAPFAISKTINLLLAKNALTEVVIELTDLDIISLKTLLSHVSYKTVFNSLIGLIPRKIIPLVLAKSEIKDSTIIVSKLSEEQFILLLKTIKDFRFKATKTDDFSNAQITVGGINLDEVNSQTLESKIVKGLYFCGEVLDVDSKSGGFNLQWAWSSGYLAGLLL